MHPRYLTLWILGGVALATLAAAACGTANEPGAEQVSSSLPTPRNQLQAVAEIPPEYVPVPGGILVHQDCIHEVPDGAEVAADFTVRLRGVTIGKHSPCEHQAYRLVPRAAARGAGDLHPPAFQGGWVENSLTSKPTKPMFTHMDSGTWQVPSAPPSDDGELIYFYPSFSNHHWIVQPVLQWYGGSWGMNNWAVWGNGTMQVFKGTLTTVSVGDQLKGVLNLAYNNASSQIWEVGWTDITRGTSATDAFTIPDGDAFIAAGPAVLEAWYVKNCNDFPGSGFTQFSAPTLYQGYDYSGRILFNPTWYVSTWDNNFWDGPLCNFGVNVFSDGTTQLYY